MSFLTMMKDYFKRVRQFYGLQRQDNSQSLEGRGEYSIFPKNIEQKPKNISSSSNDNSIKVIDIKPEYKTVERK